MLTSLLLVIGAAIAVSFLCSVLEAVLLSLTHSYVAVLAEEDPKTSEILTELRENIEDPIAAILTLNTIAHTAGAAFGGALAHRVLGDEWMALFSALLTLAILVFSEVIPKTLGATYWQKLAPFTARTLRILLIVMRPVLLPLSLINRLIAPNTKYPTVSRAELEIMAEIGRREGAIDEEEWEVVSNVMNLDQVAVGEVMTPRTLMVSLPREASVSEAKHLMLEEGHFRLPVYEGSVDNITGIVLARDLWKAESKGAETIEAIVRPIQFVPLTKPVEDLIREMRTSRVKMAIVLDEFGGTAGLVTLEDLIEEIVGEIQDEHEEEPLPFEDDENGSTQISGDVPLWEVNERFSLSLPEDLYDTIGGYVFGRLGRLAEEGDRVLVDEGYFEVLALDGRRIDRLSFLRVEPGDEVTPEFEEEDAS